MNTQTTKQIYQSIHNHFFDDVIVKIDNLVFVNLDWLTNRNHQFEGVNEFLFEIGQYKNHTVVFMIRDGVNPRFTGMIEIIKQTIQDLNLNRDLCYIYGYEELDIPNTTYLPSNAVGTWSGQVHAIIKDLPLSNNQFTKRFSGMYGRFDLYRLKLYRHLVTHHADTSLLSFNSGSVYYNHRFDQHFQDDHKWFMQHGGQVIDYESGYGSVLFQYAMQDIHRHYQTYFLEIVAETNTYSNRFFTEKTVKNFHLGKPFLLLNGQHSLRYLHSLGFQTFAPWIDESYDTISSSRDRLAAITAEIDRLAAMSLVDLQQMHAQMKSVFEHNRKRFEQIF
jgi:hypothetical protein